ncbi:hypothetical protein D5086_025738 [Populus alba]|uniref:Uncharacterized protein n=1 Tax=Populus alba TaxID=43335 RepID=A0ACC4B0G3_POPAL
MKRTYFAWTAASVFALIACLPTTPTVSCRSLQNLPAKDQIRRYVYNDVLRLDDAQKLFDCAFVQSYTTNSAKVIFLNHRPQTRIVNIRGNNCSTCDRGLQYPYLFCSISCKVDHILTTKGVGGLSSFFCDCKFLPLSEPGSDDGLMTPDSVLEPTGSTKTSSSSGGYGGVDCKTLACTATTEIKEGTVPGSSLLNHPRPTAPATRGSEEDGKGPDVCLRIWQASVLCSYQAVEGTSSLMNFGYNNG